MKSKKHLQIIRQFLYIYIRKIKSRVTEIQREDTPGDHKIDAKH